MLIKFPINILSTKHCKYKIHWANKKLNSGKYQNQVNIVQRLIKWILVSDLQSE